MNALEQKEYTLPLSEEDRRKLAGWKNAGGLTNELRLLDRRGLPIDWDQYEKRSQYGWVIEYILPLEEGGKDEYSNLRARHWCQSLEQYEAGLQL